MQNMGLGTAIAVGIAVGAIAADSEGSKAGTSHQTPVKFEDDTSATDQDTLEADDPWTNTSAETGEETSSEVSKAGTSHQTPVKFEPWETDQDTLEADDPWTDTSTETGEETSSEVSKARTSHQTPVKFEDDTSATDQDTLEADDPWTDTPAETEEETHTSEAEESLSAMRAAKGTAASGTTISAAEVARQKGLDRHAEAELAENLYAKVFERQGYTVIDEGSSVFTPDGGVDKTLVRGSEELKMQVKHHGNEVGHHTLKQCVDSDIDILATTNGVKDGVNPSEYGIEVLTKEDLPLLSRVKVPLTRIKNGIQEVLESEINRTDNATNGLLGRIWNGVKWAGKKLFSDVKSIGERALSAAKSAGTWYFRLSVGKQILVGSLAVVTVAGTSYYLWKWFQDENSLQSPNRRATVA